MVGQLRLTDLCGALELNCVSLSVVHGECADFVPLAQEVVKQDGRVESARIVTIVFMNSVVGCCRPWEFARQGGRTKKVWFFSLQRGKSGAFRVDPEILLGIVSTLLQLP